MGERSTPATPAPFDERTDFPLLDSPDPAEASYILNYVREEGYVYYPDRGDGPTLTVKGWSRLEPGPGGIPGRCFVAMSFADGMRDAYDHGIRLALENDCKLHATQLALLQHNEKICDKVLVEIRLAEFTVADVTHQRQNVYFEAGFAMALGRPVIWTCQEDDFGRIHFDTRQYPYIKWATPQDLREQLTDRVRATIPSVQARLGRPQ